MLHNILCQVLFQVGLAILKYNESNLLKAKDEIEIMTVLSDFLASVGQKPQQQDKNIRGSDEFPHKVSTLINALCLEVNVYEVLLSTVYVPTLIR